ncbi:TetR/AcrR family transcriptional regulator [Rhodococcus globerulus]|uniref:TetR/AcrR family transcriptional regulator n=1 Tax=Rhodococcus globerulus TaxID=33008 RepID=UPI000B86B16A|nr:TetR/AcrR family transcriptional regulator [Rhodococcus globerulus]
MDGGALPRAVELAWGLDQPGTRGPKKGLSLEQILDSAIELADAEGVTALSMGRVAKSLGFTTMSLYRYVASKDELIELISDRVIGPPPVIPDGVSWRAKLEVWANQEYATMLSRPWWLKLPITAPPTGPNNMAWLDAGLSALDGVALSAASKFQVVTNVSLFVIGRARFSADLASRSAQSADDDVAYGALIARVINREDFPYLSAAIEEGGFEDGSPEGEAAGDDAFDFGFSLGLLLDGIEKLVQRSGHQRDGTDVVDDQVGDQPTS